MYLVFILYFKSLSLFLLLGLCMLSEKQLPVSCSYFFFFYLALCQLFFFSLPLRFLIIFFNISVFPTIIKHYISEEYLKFIYDICFYFFGWNFEFFNSLFSSSFELYCSMFLINTFCKVDSFASIWRTDIKDLL